MNLLPSFLPTFTNPNHREYDEENFQLHTPLSLQHCDLHINNAYNHPTSHITFHIRIPP